MPRTYTSREAAKVAGITRQTLQDWIKKGKFRAPALVRLGEKGRVRFWTAEDVARLKTVKKEIYQEQNHRPKK